MGRYEITGRTSVFFTDRAVGEVFEADLEPDFEQQLIEVGAIRKLEEKKKAEAPKAGGKRGPAK
jgi:hypothetical protein